MIYERGETDMKQAYYLYEANLSKGEMLLANDSSSFTRPFFESAQVGLKAFSNLTLSSSCLFFPSREGEDETMKAKRSDFRIADWMLLALVVDGNDEISSVLILERSNHDHCLVFSFSEGQVVVCSCQGIEVREEMEEKMTAKEFLSTLNVPSATQSFAPISKGKPTNLGYASEGFAENEEEDDAPINIAFERPTFVPNAKKGKAINLGSSPHLVEEEEEDDGPLNIDIQKQAFTPSNGKKPRNLDVYVDKRPQKAIQIQSEDTDDAPLNIEVKKDAFTAGSGKKPKNLSVPPSRGKIETPKKEIPEEEPDFEKIASSYQKPSFSPNAQLKHTPSQSAFEKPSTPNQRPYAQVKEEEVIASEVKVNKVSPTYFFSCKGANKLSRTVINDPSLFYVHKVFDGRWRRILTERSTLVVNDSSVTLGNCTKPASSLDFNSNDYDILAANVNEDNEPFAYLLSSKKEPMVTIAIERKEDAFVLLCLSDRGIEVLDPRLDYPSLRSMCFPTKEGF